MSNLYSILLLFAVTSMFLFASSVHAQIQHHDETANTTDFPTESTVETTQPSAASVKKKGRGLIIPGTIVLSTGYAVSVGAGIYWLANDVSIGGLNLIPLVGPAILGAYTMQDASSEGWGLLIGMIGVTHICLSVVQIVGAALLVAGVTKRKRTRQKKARAKQAVPVFAILPPGPSRSNGISVSLTF